MKLKNFKLIRRSIKLFYGFLIGMLIFLASLVLITTFNISGKYKLLVVESGSMSPTISQGSLILISPSVSYKKNDIITVADSAKTSVTHRLMEVKKIGNQNMYLTKGDGNEDPDTKLRLEQNVIGKVIFSVPLLGYFVDFAKTKNGILFLIIIPCVLIIFSELIKIKNEIFLMLKKRNYV